MAHKRNKTAGLEDFFVPLVLSPPNNTSQHLPAASVIEGQY
jgi:hypothetical protein